MLTQERLKELLHYNPETGIFTRIGLSIKSVRTDKMGKTAGGINDTGYWRTSVEGIRYLSHRLAYLYMEGSWPTNEIDHINGERADNRWLNLRDATRKENAQNRTKLQSSNTSGYMGVSYSKEKNKWAARIKINDLYKFLGYFSRKEDAGKAFMKAKRKYHAGCTI